MHKRGSQRGAIAVMAAVMVLTLCLFGFSAIALAQFVVHRRAQSNGIDAMAIGDAMVLMSTKGPGAPAFLSASEVFAHNTDTTSGAGASVIGYYPGNFFMGSSGSGQQDGLYIPGQVTVSATAASLPLWQFSAPPAKGNSQAYYSQIAATNFTIVQKRVMLMLDFSKSTRLAVTNGGTKAIVVLHQAMADMVNQPSTTRANWGLRIFGGEDPALYEYALFPDTLNLNPCMTIPADARAQSILQMTAMGGPGAPGSTDATDGNSTDIASAIDDVVSVPEMAVTTNANIGTPNILLVTDGEPDSYKDVTTGDDYATKVATAVAAAKASVAAAWAAGINTYVIQIVRENEAYSNAADTDFLTSIAGSKAGPDSRNITQATDEPMLQTDLLTVPFAPHCRTRRNLHQMQTPYARIPGPNDIMFGFVGNTSTGAEIPAVYCGQSPASSPNATVDTCTNQGDGAITVNALGGTDSRAGAVYAFKYDPENMVFETNGWICQDFMDTNGVNLGNTLQLRVRWGIPYLCADRTNVGGVCNAP